MIAVRKLRPYFQAHFVTVLTDQSLRQILQKPEYSGRLTKWSIELSEYDISFEPRRAIKRQALANFIVECTYSPPIEEVQGKDWMLFVDGASNAKRMWGRDSVDFPGKGDLGILPTLHLPQLKQRSGI